MNHLTFMEDGRGALSAAREEAVGLLLGTGFTLALFLGMARFENFSAAEPVAVIEDMRMAALPLEPPPPTPRIEEPVPVAALPFAGLEVGATDSPVAIAVVPPDLEALVPAMTNPPGARIQFDVLQTELKPRMELEADNRHIYQDTEVDQKPRAVVRTVPPIPPDVRGDAPTLRVGLVLLIGQNGKPESVRVMESSGNPRFDALVANTMRDEWLFSPAIRRGRKVRVMAQQAFRINFTNGASPFSVSR